jgi:uncharacterized membrane protein
MTEQVIVADCSKNGPNEGITVRDETVAEKNYRAQIVGEQNVQRAAEEDRAAAMQEIRQLAEKDANASISAGLVARALGLV